KAQDHLLIKKGEEGIKEVKLFHQKEVRKETGERASAYNLLTLSCSKIILPSLENSLRRIGSALS
ncbi:MAG: hypothetical protein ACI9DJ_000621, partial [Algoriphagus sp.]